MFLFYGLVGYFRIQMTYFVCLEWTCVHLGTDRLQLSWNKLLQFRVLVKTHSADWTGEHLAFLRLRGHQAISDTRRQTQAGAEGR